MLFLFFVFIWSINLCNFGMKMMKQISKTIEVGAPLVTNEDVDGVWVCIYDSIWHCNVW
jgi:hypothetical protein